MKRVKEICVDGSRGPLLAIALEQEFRMLKNQMEEVQFPPAEPAPGSVTQQCLLLEPHTRTTNANA